MAWATKKKHEVQKRPNVTPFGWIEKTQTRPMDHLFGRNWTEPGLTYKENPVKNLVSFDNPHWVGLDYSLIYHNHLLRYSLKPWFDVDFPWLQFVNKYIKQIQETVNKKQNTFSSPTPTISFTGKFSPQNQPLALWCCDPESPTLTWIFSAWDFLGKHGNHPIFPWEYHPN